MKSFRPIKLLSIVVLVFAAIFVSLTEQRAAAAIDKRSSTQQQRVDHSKTVYLTFAEVCAVPASECRFVTAWMEPGADTAMVRFVPTALEPVKELAGYRSLYFGRPKIIAFDDRAIVQRPKLATYTGMGNTRAREQV